LVVSLVIPNLPLELAVPVGALVKAASLLRGVLVETATRPVAEVLHQYAESLRVADRVVTVWVEKVGLRMATAEEAAAADALGQTGADGTA
jgi:hypothetical protein